jgi:ribosome-associated protein
VNLESLHKELSFRTSRSGGRGGQNVNKVETKVELIWNCKSSNSFSEDEKEKLLKRLQNRLDSENLFHLYCQTERTQYGNKLKAIAQFDRLIIKALIDPKKRIATKISIAKKEKRLKAKKEHSAIKKHRAKDWKKNPEE